MSFRSFLKNNTLLHFIYYLYKDEKFRRGYFRYLFSQRLIKSRRTIKHEVAEVGKYWNYPPYHYYRYKLYEKDISIDEILDYIPPYYYYNIYWEKRHKDLNTELYQSKFFQDKLFTKHGIPSMEVLAIVKNRELLDSGEEAMEVNTLLDKYLANETDMLFCKPEFGRGGVGIVVLARRNGQLLLNNKPVEIYQVLPAFSNSEDYIVQKGFIQSTEMSKINSSSVNTLRIYTQFNDGKVYMPACILRMGVNNSYVDNLSQGGLMNIIDVEDGSLSEYSLIKLENRKYYEHPDSKYVFKGARIENWKEIKEKILQYSGLLNECRDLGWDVAVGENGFKVLEINIAHGMDHPQMIFGGMRRIIGVYPE